MKTPIRFMVIDDDLVNNLLCTIVIEEVAPELEIKTFEVAEEGFEYIRKEYLPNKDLTILFLDINMPIWSGWEFLDNFQTLDDTIKNHFKIYMLSSSVDPADEQRARENINVLDYLEKPLSEKTVLSILAKQKE